MRGQSPRGKLALRLQERSNNTNTNNFPPRALGTEVMLTEFFLVKEQDSGPSESMRYKRGKIGDMSGEFFADDETSGGPMDFHSTFVELSHHRDYGPSETADQVDRRRPRGDDIVGRPLEAKEVKNETDVRNGTDTKRSGGANAISEPIGLSPSQMVSEKDSGRLAVRDLTAKEQMAAADQANRGQIHKSKTLKGDTLAILEPKRETASAEKGNTKPVSISSQAYPAKGAFGLASHTVREANIMATGSSMTVDGQTTGVKGKSKVYDLKTAMPFEESGTVRRDDGQPGKNIGKSQVNDLRMAMAGAKDKATETPASESVSFKRIEAPITADTAKSKLLNLKMVMAGAKDKGSLRSVSESGASRKMDSQATTAVGKDDVGFSREIQDSQRVRLSDQGIEKAWLKSHFSEALAREGGLTLKGTFSASGKEKSQKHSAGTSKEGSASTGMTSKSSQSGMTFNMGVGEARETGENRHVKKTSRIDLNRDGRKKQDASKVGLEEKTGETTRGKGKEENASAKSATRVSTSISEQSFDRTALKSDTIISDNSPFTSSSASSSTKTPVNVPHFAETEVVRRSFQENGVRELVEKAALNLKNGQQEFRIELKPEFLGQVKVQVSTENHQVTIKILTELPLAKEMIENNLYQLKAELQGQGLEIGKCEVYLSQGSDKNGVGHGFSESKEMKRGPGQKGASKSVSSTPDRENEDWARNQRSGNGAINLFA
jgi:flagellar hook-length control protein FliK